MLKWERRLAEFIDRHLYLFVFLLVTLCVFLMHRAGYWHTSFDLQSHFYPDLPEYLHTPFYTLLLKVLPILSDTPVVLLKKIICLFDFVAAFGALFLLHEEHIENRTALLACYTLLLVSPLTIENGLIWIHVDSLCMSALLWAFVLYKRKHPLAAGLLLGIGAAILTPYAIVFFVLLFLRLRKKEQVALTLGVGVLFWLCLNVFSSVLLGTGLQRGLLLTTGWLFRSPKNGLPFTGILPWLKAMPAYFGYMAGTFALIGAFRKPRYRVPAAILHILIFLYLGNILQQGW